MSSYHRLICGAAAIGLVVACGRDPGPPTLRQIILSPASANIGIGEAQQFDVRGRMSDGSTVTVSVTYAATGGTITSGGLYTAGGVTGTYRVIATLSGGTQTDTAAITLTPTGVHNYTTTFPLTESPISEGGHWVNGGAAGLDWTNVSTTPGLAIGHQVGASYTDATAILTGTWGPNQRVAAAVHTASQKDACYQEVELRLRSAISASVNTGYEISYKLSQSADAYLIIVRWNGALGNFTYLSRQSGAQYGAKDGDVVSASMVGNVITAYKNGVQMGQATDSTFTAGTPGMGFNLENGLAGCRGTNGDYGFTSYTASDDAAALPPSTPNVHPAPQRPLHRPRRPSPGSRTSRSPHAGRATRGAAVCSGHPALQCVRALARHVRRQREHLKVLFDVLGVRLLARRLDRLRSGTYIG